MKRLLDGLNKRGTFHTVLANGDVEIRKQPADLSSKGKDLLKKYYGLEDFSVPKELKNPFDNKASSIIEEMKKTALSKSK